IRIWISTCHRYSIIMNRFGVAPVGERASGTASRFWDRFSLRAGAVFKEANDQMMMRGFMRPAAAILLIGVGLLFIPASSAQVQSPSPGLLDPSPNTPDHKLDATAAAIKQLASLKQDYQHRIAAAAPSHDQRLLLPPLRP